MSALTAITPQVTAVLGWTLIHFVWQATVIAAALGFVLQLIPRGFARTRYVAGCVALALMPLASVATAWRVAASRGGGSAVVRSVGARQQIGNCCDCAGSRDRRSRSADAAGDAGADGVVPACHRRPLRAGDRDALGRRRLVAGRPLLLAAPRWRLVAGSAFADERDDRGAVALGRRQRGNRDALESARATCGC